MATSPKRSTGRPDPVPTLPAARRRPTRPGLAGGAAEPTRDPTDALKLAGAGVVLGGMLGVMAGRSERDVVAGGVAGGTIALVINDVVRDDGQAVVNVALAVRQSWGLTRDAFARLIGYAPRTIAGYEAGDTLAAVPLRRYTEIQRLRTALEQVMNPGFVSTWLNAPNPAFDGSSPIQVIERGEIDRVWASVYYLDSGMS